MVDLLQAEAAMARGDPRSANETLRVIVPERTRSVLAMRANAILEVKTTARSDLQRVDEALREWLADHGDDGLIWSLQARTAESLGRSLQSLRARAEVRASEGDLAAAIDRLRAAQRASRGAYGPDLLDASIIDARLRELEARQRSIAGPGTRPSGVPPG